MTGPGALAVVGPSGSLAVYLAAGMVATVNPCGFAMLPAYLSYFLGLEGDDAGSAHAGVGQAIRVALAVSAGFLAVFAGAGLVVELTSLPLYEAAPWVSIVIGLALLGLGAAMVGGVEVAARLPRLDRGGRSRSVRSMALFGVSYAVASIGCTLPLFLSAVAGTMGRDGVADGVVVFATYAVGMALVLMALTVAIALTRTSVVRALRQAQRHVNRVAGGLVAVAGLYVAHYGWIEVRTYRDGTAPDSGLADTVTGWSYDIRDWVERVGPTRLAAALAVGLVTLVALLRWLRTPTTN